VDCLVLNVVSWVMMTELGIVGVCIKGGGYCTPRKSRNRDWPCGSWMLGWCSLGGSLWLSAVATGEGSLGDGRVAASGWQGHIRQHHGSGRRKVEGKQLSEVEGMKG
jgi:hypothetical protein